MSKPILPLDVIGNIIESLVEDIDEGLDYVKACSLVCHSFLPLCRAHIFSSITIKVAGNTGSSDSDERYYSNTTEAFGQLVLETPEIARSIRNLYIIIVDPRSQSGHLFNQVPQNLTRLQLLSLSRWCTVDWNNISSSMQHSLLNLVHIPTLSHLSLKRIKNFPISHLDTCTNLKQLFAEALYIQLGTGEQNESASSLLSHKPMRLQELGIKIFKMSDLLLLTARRSDGRTVLDFSGLEKISITFLEALYAVHTRDIFRMTQQLVEVRFKVPDNIFSEIKFAKMIAPSLQTLRRVHLTLVVDEESEDPLAGFCEELEAISGENQLESIEIVTDFRVFRVSEDSQSGADTWSGLEKVLLQPGWPTLKHVSLLIIIYRKNDSLFKVALERLREKQFAGLMSSNNIDFQFSIQGPRF